MELQMVKQAAQYRWVEILPVLAGLNDKQVSVKEGKAGTPCPICGGEDRYSFKKELHGEWACRGCGDGRGDGGDGIDLVMKVNCISKGEAIKQIASYLGLSPATSINVKDISRRRQEVEGRAKQEAKEEELKTDKAKLRAQTKWGSLGYYTGNAYSQHKRFSPTLQVELRQQGQCISAPVYDATGELISVQDFPGTKDNSGKFKRYFAKNTSTKGGLLQWGQESLYILIGEGVATVDAGYQLAGSNRLAVCAFMASQLPVIAAIVRSRYPESQIVILADQGKVGEKYAIQTVQQVENCQAVLPPTGNDWSDYFLAGGQLSPLEVEPIKISKMENRTQPEAKTMSEETSQANGNVVPFPAGEQWPEVKPLNTDLLPVKPITPEMLPSALSCWLVDIVERMDNAPFEYAAISAIVVASSLIGRKLVIKPKRYDDWAVVPNLWGCCIGRPSAKKSPVMKVATKPLGQLEAEARKQHKENKKVYEAKEKITLMAMKEAEKKAAALVKKGDMQAAEALLMDDSGDPDKPVCKRYIVNNSSIEKLGIVLEENPWGLLYLRDELSGWLAGLCREDRQQDRAFLLEAFNGDGSFSYDRVTREDVYIESNTVSVLGGIQPAKLLPLLMGQREGGDDDGLVERFQLMVYPDKRSFKYADRMPSKPLRDRAYEVFSQLDSIEYQELEEDRPVLRFDDEAQQLFNHWYCGLMERVGREGISPQTESHLGKYPSLMPSLAGIFHVIDNGITGKIKAHSVRMAIEWCNVLETHANRVYALANDPLAGARILAERLDKLPTEFKGVDLRAKGWTGLKEPFERERALSILEAHGYIVKNETRKSDRGRASVTYKTNPAALPDNEE